jgi:hypothetical protein
VVRKMPNDAPRHRYGDSHRDAYLRSSGRSGESTPDARLHGNSIKFSMTITGRPFIRIIANSWWKKAIAWSRGR